MKRAWKWILPLVLLALVALVFSYDSLAAFTKSISLQSGAISAKSFTFYVNESSSQSQSLGSATLAPGESKSYSVVLDGRSCETPVEAVVTLSVSHDGVWPDGLNVLFNGETVNDGFTHTYSDLQSAGETKTVNFEVVWNDPHLYDYEAFSGFQLHLTMTVVAQQTN
ncbi:MAG: hypothetical protein ABFD03_10430 [Clostridiaceae bacterium]